MLSIMLVFFLIGSSTAWLTLSTHPTRWLNRHQNLFFTGRQTKTRKGVVPGGTYSFVEGDEFDESDPVSLESTGGDPAFILEEEDFIDIEENEGEKIPSFEEFQRSLHGADAGDVENEEKDDENWVWDGVEDEGAYFDD